MLPILERKNVHEIDLEISELSNTTFERLTENNRNERDGDVYERSKWREIHALLSGTNI